jgi:hypothetical protein
MATIACGLIADTEVSRACKSPYIERVIAEDDDSCRECVAKQSDEYHELVSFLFCFHFLNACTDSLDSKDRNA